MGEKEREGERRKGREEGKRKELRQERGKVKVKGRENVSEWVSGKVKC